ncbi:GntR family transcriptional regulator [Amycolatopsis sp. cg5]|uniref:GntR family transcriptional regulator n=1 Tax=Amycolatopsis sp. cg5 TaxID=3238802 RepID=UPI0035262618
MTKAEPAGKQTTTGQAYDAILELIKDGTFGPGEPLRLQKLSTELGMSMTPIREALRRLESTGLVDLLPHRGAVVRPLSLDDLVDTYRTRILLEGTLCRRAAQHFDKADESRAFEALEAQRAALERGDAEQARVHHKEFHYAIYAAAGSAWLMRSTEQTWHNSERYRIQSESDNDLLTTRRQEHERMLAACVKHDPDEALEALRAHLISTVSHLDAGTAKRLLILTS